MSEKTRCEYLAARAESQETWREAYARREQDMWRNKKE